jgi:hypothetical protein
MRNLDNITKKLKIDAKKNTSNLDIESFEEFLCESNDNIAENIGKEIK